MNTYNDFYPPFTAEKLAILPEEMKNEVRWVCWGGEKIPVSVFPTRDETHFGIDVTKPDNWGTFDQAVAAIGHPCYVKSSGERFHIVGIGFVVGDGWFCVDMDGGKKHQGKENVPEEAITDALRIMDTYAEKSLSGCGFHVLGKCDFSSTDAERNKPHRDPNGEPVPNSYEIEFFTRRKFIVITGRQVSGSNSKATDCSASARKFYNKYVFNDWKNDEQRCKEKRKNESASIPINVDNATELFLCCYPEILAASDSSNFKRGGRGLKLAPGEYSWIGAIKAMQEIGIPECAIMDWCKRGSNFKSEKDVLIVLNQQSSLKKASVAGIIADAKAHGWKPDPKKLTGKYKERHDTAEAYKAEQTQREQEYKEYCNNHREERIALLAEVGIITEDPEQYTWSYDFDMNIIEVKVAETDKTVYIAPNPTNKQAIEGISVITAPIEKNPENNKCQSTLVGYDDVDPKPIDFMYYPMLPRGYITAIQGDSGSGKSTLMYAIGAKISTGSDLLGIPCEDPGNVLFITSEDEAGDIKISFMDAGGDIGNLRRIKDREEIAKIDLSPAGAAKLNAYIKEGNIKLLVLDPIQQFLAGDMNKASETRPQMARLMNIAAENNICIVIIEHMGKDTTRSAQHRALGSVDINASSRSQLQVVTDPECTEYKILFTVKSNLAAPRDTKRAIRYQIKDHQNSYDPATNKRIHYRGHAEFIDLLPEYNEKLFRKATQKTEEESILQFEYNEEPIVTTARELIAQNPEGLFIGTDDLVQRITEVCGHCPYEATSSKTIGIYSRMNKLRKLMIDNDAIQADIQSNPKYPKPYYWHGTINEPEHRRTRGIMLTPVKTRREGYQQTKK